MARRKRSYRRRARRIYGRIRRSLSNVKIPLEVAAGLVSIPFFKAASFQSPYDYAKQGLWNEAVRSMIYGFTGVDTTGAVKPSIGQILNPLDFSAAGMTKILIVTGAASKIRKRFVKIPMNKIPFIGRMIS